MIVMCLGGEERVVYFVRVVYVVYLLYVKTYEGGDQESCLFGVSVMCGGEEEGIVSFVLCGVYCR